jgi:hypothetical protein
MKTLISLALLALLTTSTACDRNIEPFVPGEKSVEPDLSQIFPAGAERAARPSPGLPPPPGQLSSAPAAPAAPAAQAAAPIRGSVKLAPELSESVPPGAVLFLIARGPSPGPPLAVQKIADPKFPLEFSIGPEDRMMRDMPFVGPISISARIDADGNATTRGTGDLQGESPGNYQPGATGVDVLIDELQSDATSEPAARAPASNPPVVAASQAIAGTVVLAPELVGRVPEGAVLFLIVRTAATGPPLAVQRIPAPQFPFEFSIGPDDRMIKAMQFAGPIQITARVDADANAMTRTAGDLFGSSAGPHAPGDVGIGLTIEQVVP